MAGILQGLFGRTHQHPSPVPVGDADFAEFAGTPVAKVLSPLSVDFSSNNLPTAPYSKWYNFHERYSPSDFVQEGLILGFLFIIITVHIWGTSINRKNVKKLINTLGPSLRKEFGLVGFERIPSNENDEWHEEDAEDILREISPSDFVSYATGRQNIAFLDINITLLKRYSPLSLLAEGAMSILFESISAPSENFEAIIYPFDGREALLLPKNSPISTEQRKDFKSSFDGFVWALVNKDYIRNLRDDRYDLSLTSTKDSRKLPAWITVMSENSEITEILLTSKLIHAIEQSNEILKYLIITDQPIDQPLKLEDTTPRKRIYLGLKISSAGDFSSIIPIFQHFLHLTDFLVEQAHFRPEVIRKLKATRDEATRKLVKLQEDQKAEERNLEREKAKKLKRDLELKALDSKAQKKYLEREKEKEMRKNQKKFAQKR